MASRLLRSPTSRNDRPIWQTRKPGKCRAFFSGGLVPPLLVPLLLVLLLALAVVAQ
jgi:hypothetical protein